jgi:hypothetical protein
MLKDPSIISITSGVFYFILLTKNHTGYSWLDLGVETLKKRWGGL